MKINTNTSKQMVHEKSNEKNFSSHFFARSKFCSASTITSLFSYLTLIHFNVLRYKLNFFPTSVIMILSTISMCSLRSHLIFLYVVVRGISLFSNTIALKDFEVYTTQFMNLPSLHEPILPLIFYNHPTADLSLFAHIYLISY
jgi:hypothetical protein